MTIDISLLPALAASFMLIFARVGAMVMLLPGLGEVNVPVRVRLAVALLLTLLLTPLHRSAYQINMTSLTPMLVLMVHEIIIGVVLGATARVTVAALQVAGSVIAQQLGLGFVTAVDPTQGSQGVLIGNFLTILGVALLRSEERRVGSFAPARSCRAGTSPRSRHRLSQRRSASAFSCPRRFSCSAWSSISASVCWRA